MGRIESLNKITQVQGIAFDLDDTLCDYATSKRNALAHLATTISTSAGTQEHFIASYRLNEPHLYKAFLNKSLSIEDYRRRRFQIPLKAVRITPSITRIDNLNRAYMKRCNEGVELFPEAIDVLDKLQSTGFPLALITNGPSDGQRTKLKALGIEDRFKSILISAETRLVKPDARIFHAAADALGISIDGLLMVGDSIKDDYSGAVRAGAQALLIDRSSRPNSVGIKRVKDLSELTR